MLALAFVLAFQTPAAPSPYLPLSVYNGTWSVAARHPFGGQPGAVDKLGNHCTETADAYTCDQTVNGLHVATVIFAVTPEPGTFSVTNVLPTGKRLSNTRLLVHGDHWEYVSSTPPADANETTYRVENTFHDRDHIHFSQSESHDAGKTWTETNSGDETRLN